MSAKHRRIEQMDRDLLGDAAKAPKKRKRKEERSCKNKGAGKKKKKKRTKKINKSSPPKC